MSDLPKTPKLSPKRKREILIIGAAGILILFLYLRSRSANSSSSTNATNAADTQAAIDNAVQQQQAQDAASYGYGAYGAGSSSGGYSDGSGSVDLAPVTSGLSQLDTDLQNLPSQIAAQTPLYTSGPNPPAAAAPPAATPPDAQAPVTVQIIGQPAGTKAAGVRLSTHVPHGDIAAPFGSKKPAAPKGWEAVGTGAGNWAFRPAAPKTGSSSHHQARHKTGRHH